jgi:hypothetical protein
LIILYDLFDMLLNSVYQYFIEDFCIYVRLRDWLVISLYCVLIQFGNEYNAGFIECVWQWSFPFYFREKFEKCVLALIYDFRSFRVCWMKLGALTLGAYRLMIICFWSISPFISMECLSLSHMINVGLKSTLSEISIATPACF